MILNISIATEETEVEKLLAAEKQAKQNSEFDILHNSFANKEMVRRESEVEDTNASDDTDTSNNVTAGVDSDTDETALEHFRSLQYTRISTEDFDDGSIGSKILNTVKSGAAAIGSGIAYLYELGVAHGPDIIRNVYKGVLYAFSKLAKLTITGTVLVNKYIERRNASFTSIKSDITLARKALSDYKSKSNKAPEVKYSNTKVINRLKIGSNVDLKNNVDTMSDFLSELIKNISSKVHIELNTIKHLIALSSSGTVRSPVALMQIKSANIGLTKETLSGYEPSSDLVTSYVSKTILPGDVTFIAHMPNEDLSNLEEVTEAYNNSSLFFGLSTDSYVEINSIDYMTAEQLNSFLDSLDKLCDICIAQHSLYNDIKRIKNSMKFSIKNYFMSVAASENKMSLEATLVEYVYLKSMFVDKVYITAAMDVHDLSAKLLTAGLAYARDNISKL